ncbi:MAG: hypothetical protein WC269_00965, partial [Candidatus Gracilibacteria bacterium]
MAQNPTQSKEKKTKLYTDEQQRYIKKLGIQRATKGVNPLRHEALNDIINYFKNNTDLRLEDIRDEENPYKLFMTALNKKLFPNNGKNAVKFLEALGGSAAEKKVAKKFISNLAHGEGQISVAKEKAALKELDKAKKQSDVDEAQDKVGTTMDVIANTASTWGKFNEILDAGERTKLNYKPEKLSEKTSAQLRTIAGLNEATREAIKEEKELDIFLSLPNAEKDEAIQRRIKMIEKH